MIFRRRNRRSDSELDRWIKSAVDAELAQMDSAFDFESGLAELFALAGLTESSTSERQGRTTAGRGTGSGQVAAEQGDVPAAVGRTETPDARVAAGTTFGYGGSAVPVPVAPGLDRPASRWTYYKAGADAVAAVEDVSPQSGLRAVASGDGQPPAEVAAQLAKIMSDLTAAAISPTDAAERSPIRSKRLPPADAASQVPGRPPLGMAGTGEPRLPGETANWAIAFELGPGHVAASAAGRVAGSAEGGNDKDTGEPGTSRTIILLDGIALDLLMAAVAGPVGSHGANLNRDITLIKIIIRPRMLVIMSVTTLAGAILKAHGLGPLAPPLTRIITKILVPALDVLLGPSRHAPLLKTIDWLDALLNTANGWPTDSPVVRKWIEEYFVPTTPSPRAPGEGPAAESPWPGRAESAPPRGGRHWQAPPGDPPEPSPPETPAPPWSATPEPSPPEAGALAPPGVPGPPESAALPSPGVPGPPDTSAPLPDTPAPSPAPPPSAPVFRLSPGRAPEPEGSPLVWRTVSEPPRPGQVGRVEPPVDPPSVPTSPPDADALPPPDVPGLPDAAAPPGPPGGAPRPGRTPRPGAAPRPSSAAALDATAFARRRRPKRRKVTPWQRALSWPNRQWSERSAAQATRALSAPVTL